MAGYNLTENQRRILRTIVAARDEGYSGSIRWSATMQSRAVAFSDGRPEVPATQSDVTALAEERLIDYRPSPTMPQAGGMIELRQAGIDAVRSGFVAPSAPGAGNVYNFHGGQGAVQVGDHNRAQVNQDRSDAAAAMLPQMVALQSQVNALALNDRDIGMVLQEIVLALQVMKEKPEEGKGRLAALFDRAKPWVELAGAIVAMGAK